MNTIAAKKIVLSKLLRDLLGRPVSIKNLSAKEVSELVEGFQVMNNGEALAEKLMQLAVQGKEWAIAIVLERTEGRAVQAAKEDGSDKTTEERLDYITTQHLNSLAKRHVERQQDEQPIAPVHEPAEVGSRPQNVSAGPASKLLGLRKDGPDGSQGLGR